MNDLEMARVFANKIKEKGGKAYYVGGYVRDEIMGIPNKDIDIEVHNIPKDILESILDECGGWLEVGSSFGIYKLAHYDLDIALPRTEIKIGDKHTDFEIEADPFIGTYKACLRRDFTMNALMKDILTNEIIDHFNGIEDIKNRCIRHVNDKSFSEDPLRVLRACQFASRFNFEIAEETIRLCQSIDITLLSKERICEELKKAFLKSNKPSLFFENLRQMNQLSYWFKEVEDLIQIEQSPKYHAEGNVWNHTMMVLDAAVTYRDKVENSYGFMCAALCHDLGKAVTTKLINGTYHTYNHEFEGLPIAKTLMTRLTNEKSLIKLVLNLVKYHMKPNVLANAKSSVKKTNHMFDDAIDPEALIYIALADEQGRISEHHVSNEAFLFERLEIYKQIMAKPYVTGKDLIDAGIIPNDQFTDYLNYAHKLRLANVDKENVLRQTLAYIEKHNKKIQNI